MIDAEGEPHQLRRDHLARDCHSLLVRPAFQKLGLISFGIVSRRRDLVAANELAGEIKVYLAAVPFCCRIAFRRKPIPSFLRDAL